MKIKQLAATSVAMMSLALAMPANAAIELNEKAKVSLFGDLRIRAEADDSEKADGTDRSRERFRYRARVGVKFAPADKWTGQIRLATNAGGLNSPHVNFDTTGSNGADIGVDQAFLAYTASDNTTLVVGKAPLKFWNTTETFWDGDINVEGGALVYKSGGFTFNGTYAVLDEGNWGNDTSAFLAQGIYSAKVGGGSLKMALGGAAVDAPDGVFQSESHIAATAELKNGPWRFSAEYIDSDADMESTAYNLQVRYKINSEFGLRAYWLHTEAFSVMGDGTFGQDDFPNPNSTGVSNFEGYRIQLDYKINAKMAADLKFFDMERIEDASTLPGTSSDAIFNELSRTRVQFNINYKF